MSPGAEAHRWCMADAEDADGCCNDARDAQPDVMQLRAETRLAHMAAARSQTVLRDMSAAVDAAQTEIKVYWFVQDSTGELQIEVAILRPSTGDNKKFFAWLQGIANREFIVQVTRDGINNTWDGVNALGRVRLRRDNARGGLWSGELNATTQLYTYIMKQLSLIHI